MTDVSRQIADSLGALTRHRLKAGYYGHGYGHGYSGHGGGGSKYAGGLSGDGSGSAINHRRVRQNARRAYKDNLIARAIVDRYAETVADVGLKWDSSPDAEILKISPEAAEGWSGDVKKRFHLWARSKTGHRSEKMNFYQAQRLYATSQQRDNDIFVRFYYSNRRDLQNPLQFEFIDPEQIVGDSVTTSVGYFNQRDGIEKDAAGREIGYKVRIRKAGRSETVPVPAIGRSGRPQMIHGFMQDYAGQTRGYSRLAHALQEFQNLTDFSLAQIMKAINQSQFFMYVKPGTDEPAGNPLDDITDFGAGPVVDAYGSDPDPTEGSENVTTESLNPVNYHAMPTAYSNQPGSTGIYSLSRGEDLKPFVNTAPADSYDKFVDSFAAYLCASAGVPVEMMLMRFGKNYSASRAALILFWRIARIWQHEMAVDFLDIVVMIWLSEEIAAGRIMAPGWSDPILKAAWLDGTWHGVALPNIDPVRQAKADLINTKEMSAKTFDMVAMEVSGSDGKSNRVKVKRELKEMGTNG